MSLPFVLKLSRITTSGLPNDLLFIPLGGLRRFRTNEPPFLAQRVMTGNAQNQVEIHDLVLGASKLRGHNRKLAQQHGLPVWYDRLALLAVSIFHLSHWRHDVTVANYLLAV